MSAKITPLAAKAHQQALLCAVDYALRGKERPQDGAYQQAAIDPCHEAIDRAIACLQELVEAARAVVDFPPTRRTLDNLRRILDRERVARSGE